MLVGPTYTLAVVEKRMNDRVNELKMELNQHRKKVGEITMDIRNNPAARGELDERKQTLLDIDKAMADIESEIEWLGKKIEEAERDTNKDSKITLTLNDCIRLGFELK